MPFTCEACGSRSDLIPAAGDVLRCPRCAGERPFVKPPLLIVTGPPGIGKSTLCARLAGTIDGAVLLDADIHAEDLVSVAAANEDYPAFWRSMMRLAHELAQNDVAVVYFATMLPDQVLVNVDELGYFDSVHFLCLTCTPDVLRTRLSRRVGRGMAARLALPGRVRTWLDFMAALADGARSVPTATFVDAGGSVDAVERDVRHWIDARLGRPMSRRA